MPTHANSLLLKSVERVVRPDGWYEQLQDYVHEHFDSTVTMLDPAALSTKLVIGHEIQKIYRLTRPGAHTVHATLQSLVADQETSRTIDTVKVTVVKPRKIVLNLTPDATLVQERRTILASLSEATGIALPYTPIINCAELGSYGPDTYIPGLIRGLNDVAPSQVALGSLRLLVRTPYSST